MSASAIDAVAERRDALRALLARPFVDAADPRFALVRHHERELARTASEVFGYRLEVGATAARLSGLPTADGLHRPIRIEPGSATGRRRPVDDWPALSDRAAVLLFLTLAALEQERAQTAIADLARAVTDRGAVADPPISVDFDARAERVAFADGLDLLVSWGILEHTAGSRESYRRREQDETEALLTIDHRRLALVLRDPVAAAEAQTIDAAMADAGHYADTHEGERRARAHRLGRRLVEDPVLHLDDLDGEDRAYFLNQRTRVERGVADATGLVIERRTEGSAAIVEGRELTDIAFPTNAVTKQLALLLCDALARLAPGSTVDPADLRAAVAELLRVHRDHWERDPDDDALVRSLTREVAALLSDLGLAAATDRGSLRPLAPCARYRAPTLSRST